MTTPDRLSDIYRATLQLPPENRAAFLESACDGDDSLRAEVESLLRCDDRSFLETPALQVAAGARTGRE